MVKVAALQFPQLGPWSKVEHLKKQRTQPCEANDGEMASAAAWEGPTAAELKAAGAEAIPGGVRVKGWVIQSHKGPILNAASLQRYEPPTLNPSPSALCSSDSSM